MDEIGIDITGHSSDGIDPYLNIGIDTVITVCDNANKSCPTFPGEAEHIHWSIPDPFSGWDLNSDQLNSFRECRELIKRKIRGFIANTN